MRPPSAERPAPPGRPPRIPETLYLNDSAAVAPWQPRDIRSLRSVANLTRRDGVEFMELVPRVPVHSEVTAYSLSDLPRALDDLRASRLSGAAVVRL